MFHPVFEPRLESVVERLGIEGVVSDPAKHGVDPFAVLRKVGAPIWKRDGFGEIGIRRDRGQVYSVRSDICSPECGLSAQELLDVQIPLLDVRLTKITRKAINSELQGWIA